MKRLIALIVALPPAFASAATTGWSADPAHSTVGFAVKHLAVSTVRGEFRKYAATLAIDDADVTRSSAEATIDVGTVDTRVEARDAHLRSPDFFDAAKYPAMTFRSTRVEKAGDGRLKVTGNLTLHGVTRPVTLEAAISPEVKGMQGEARRAFSATGKLSRKDFGLAWNKIVEASPAVGDEIAIALDLEAVKVPPKAAAD